MNKVYILFVFQIYLCYGCSIYKPNKPEIESIKISQSYPIIERNGEVSRYDTPVVKIYYYKNLTLYDLAYDFDSTVNGKLVFSQSRQHYLLHKAGESFGYDFDKHSTQIKTKVSMDSIYKIEWIFNIHIANIFKKNYLTLLSTSKDLNEKTFTEQYYLKGIDDSTRVGSISLVYSTKYKDLPFSLSPELDRSKKSKLIRVYSINAPRFYSQAGIYLQKMETTYILEKEPLVNESEIRQLFNQIAE